LEKAPHSGNIRLAPQLAAKGNIKTSDIMQNNRVTRTGLMNSATILFRSYPINTIAQLHCLDAYFICRSGDDDFIVHLHSCSITKSNGTGDRICGMTTAGVLRRYAPASADGNR